MLTHERKWFYCSRSESLIASSSSKEKATPSLHDSFHILPSCSLSLSLPSHIFSRHVMCRVVSGAFNQFVLSLAGRLSLSLLLSLIFPADPNHILYIHLPFSCLCHCLRDSSIIIARAFSLSPLFLVSLCSHHLPLSRPLLSPDLLMCLAGLLSVCPTAAERQ